MKRRDIYLLIFVLVLLGVALWSILPIHTNLLSEHGLKLGLDLKGGSYLVYQADLSELGPNENPSKS
jgi:preprotein translocase subunit SecD